MCGGPVAPGRPGPAFLCGSLICTQRHAAVLPVHRCAVCTRPLELTRWSRGVCADRACEEEWLVRRPQQAKRAAQASIARKAVARRNRAAARRGIPREERARFLVALLPRNDDQPAPLSDDRRATFERHLRAMLADARDRRAAGDTAPRDDDLPISRAALSTAAAVDDALAQRVAERELAGIGCAACRGNCCRGGGERAYLSADTMLGYLERWPDHEDDAIVARYLGFLESESLPNGCVYQLAAACALPRDLRANICNAFYCDAVNVLRFQQDGLRDVRAFMVHQIDHALEGGTFVQIAVRATASARDAAPSPGAPS